MNKDALAARLGRELAEVKAALAAAGETGCLALIREGETYCSSSSSEIWGELGLALERAAETAAAARLGLKPRMLAIAAGIGRLIA